MTAHPDADTLIQLYYGEGPTEPLAAARAHVSACAACQAEFDELRESLALLDEHGVPSPHAGFEARVWAAVAAEITPRPRSRPLRHAGLLLAWAALVVAALGLTSTWTMRQPGPQPTVEAEARESAQPLRERVLLGALDQHFDQTETLLVELLNAPVSGGDAALAYERTTADDLVSSGRLYRQTAYQTGDGEFAAVLDDLESVLVEVARSPEVVPVEDIQSWRTQIEDHGLLFKVRAVNQEIRARQVALALTPRGAS